MKLQEKIWGRMRERGYSDIAIAGTFGNISQESGDFQPDICEQGRPDGVGGIGLVQWSGGRRKQLEAYAQEHGKSWQDEDLQIEFLLKELTPGMSEPNVSYQMMTVSNDGKRVPLGRTWKPSDWTDASSVDDATAAFCWCFERPGQDTAMLDHRMDEANRYFDLFSKTEDEGYKIKIDLTITNLKNCKSISVPIGEYLLNLSDLETEQPEGFQPYMVRITEDELTVREEPNSDSVVVQIVNQGESFTIVEERGGWGRLKSGVGWISLNYTERV
jgi:hypothetical protein